MEEKLLNEIIKTTCSIVDIKSVLDPSTKKQGAPFGEGISKALNFMLSLATKMGFETTNYDGYVGEIEFGEGEDFGILCHLDTVPSGDGWDTDPFKATIIDDKIYGRGTVDDKTPAVLILYALNELKNKGVKPTKKIKLILGLDEETSWRCIDYYNTKAKMPELGFSPDADFPIINVEKGIISFKIEIKDDIFNSLKITGGNAVNVVPNKCKAILKNKDEYIKKLNAQNLINFNIDKNTITLNATGKSAHGSTPHLGDNAIKKIIYTLSNILDSNIFKNIYHLLFEDNALDNLDLNLKDDVSGILTCNVGTIDINKDTLTMLIDIRYPVTIDGDIVIERMKNAFKENVVDVIKHHTPLYVDPSSNLIKKLQEAYTLVTGKPALLQAIGGGTYSRALKQAVAFGPHFEEDEDVVHMANEYISISNIVKTYKIYEKALELLCFN